MLQKDTGDKNFNICDVIVFICQAMCCAYFFIVKNTISNVWSERVWFYPAFGCYLLNSGNL